MERPWRFESRFRRVIEAQANAELALFTVGVSFQFRAPLIRAEIDIRGFYRFPNDAAHCGRELVVEKLRHRFVLDGVSEGTLGVTQLQFSLANQMAIVTS